MENESEAYMDVVKVGGKLVDDFMVNMEIRTLERDGYQTD